MRLAWIPLRRPNDSGFGPDCSTAVFCCLKIDEHTLDIGCLLAVLREVISAAAINRPCNSLPVAI